MSSVFFDEYCYMFLDLFCFFFFFFKQKTAYEMRISDWSSDVCSSDLNFTTWLQAINITKSHRKIAQTSNRGKNWTRRSRAKRDGKVHGGVRLPHYSRAGQQPEIPNKNVLE